MFVAMMMKDMYRAFDEMTKAMCWSRLDVWSFIEEKKTDAFDDFDCTKQGKLFKFKRYYFKNVKTM